MDNRTIQIRTAAAAFARDMVNDAKFTLRWDGTQYKVNKPCLRMVVKELGLSKDQYSIRANPGGTAVSGEVTLHTDTFYLQISGSFNIPDKLQILLRTCKGQKDYTGGVNTYPGIDKLEDIPEFCTRLRQHYMNPAAKLFPTLL